MRGEQNLLLPENDSRMFTPPPETSADLALTLLIHYGFDLSGYSASELVDYWQKQYPGNWLHLAVIEALYQGRYKAVSVQQILACWQRRGQALFHFNMEFERLICSKFPQSLTALPALAIAEIKQESIIEEHLLAHRSRDSEVLASVSPRGNAKGELVLKSFSSGIREVSPIESGSSRRRDSRQSALRQGDKEPSVHSISPSLNQEDNLLPFVTTNPPIEQFTPETSANSESFTSKLKAISQEIS